MKYERKHLSEATEHILRNDPVLADKLSRAVKRPEVAASTREAQRAFSPRRELLESALAEVAVPDSNLVFETVVLRLGRPVLLVQNGDISIDDPRLHEPDADVWKTRLFDPAIKENLAKVIPAVGRIEVDNNPDYEWVGTGWLVAPDIVATNRHVAQEFGVPRNGGFAFRRGFPDANRPMSARLDLLEEFENATTQEFAVKDILYIADEEDADVALLKIERISGLRARLADHLKLAAKSAEAKQFVATIGYPASDSRVPDQDLVKKFFGDIFNKKRLAPGQILREADGLVMHDCSTLGGNSGSPIIEIASGEVLGLHFSGLFLRENRAVSSRILSGVLQRVENPHSSRTRNTGNGARETGRVDTTKMVLTASGSGGSASVLLNIPLEIRVLVGQPTIGSGTTPTNGIANAVETVRNAFASHPGVLEVRRGYEFRNGWITKDPCVVVIRSPTGHIEDLELPTEIGGIPVEVRDPGAPELFPEVDFGEAVEGVRPTSYKKPPGLSLQTVTDEMRIVCHLSPDAGWPVLKDFLSRTKRRLTIGMYDFTAPHVIEGVRDAVMTSSKTLKLVMQEGEALSSGIKKNDWPETKVLRALSDTLGNRFKHTPASVGKNRQFASSYHIKVAVRDGKAFWLSSGNWQSTNQFQDVPGVNSTDWSFLRKLNREWHVVIENANLAQQFEGYLSYDFDNAASEEIPSSAQPLFDVEEIAEMETPIGKPSYFAPLIVERAVTVTPLLTPDNYHTEALKLISAAQRQILFQNQSLNLQISDEEGDNNDPRFVALLQCLLDKQNEGIEVRIIMRGDFNPKTYIERLQEFGFDMTKIRLQDRCHTKGIIVDGRKVLVGSHNWTNEGTLANRDASLIFDDQEIAEYFAEAFWFDWKQLARPSVGRPRRVRMSSESEHILPAGWVRMSLSELL